MAIFNSGTRTRQQESKRTEAIAVSKLFDPTEAEKIVRRVKQDALMMLGGSPLFGDYTSKNETYGLFHRNEIQIGRHLGKGGFSDVYEITGFGSESDSYTERQAFSRQFYADNVKRNNGESRFVMKHLKPELIDKPKKFQMAAADLAVEGHYLSSLEHPHILKVRGWAAANTAAYKDGSHDGFFLILDRLDGDLRAKIQQWKAESAKTWSTWRRTKADARKASFFERVTVAYQIACALEYLHDRGIIFRDLKPGNVGFDTDGNVKLFDFGLSREIPKGGKMDEVFVMSGKLGTKRYMAPEVALNQKYNLKADVYSWACNFYEILGMEKPYAHFDEYMHMELCCKEGRRPALQREWPQSIKNLLKRSWDHDLHARPTMKEVVGALKLILLELNSDNKGVLTIRESRKHSVILEFPANFASSMGTAGKAMGADAATRDTSTETLDASNVA